MTRQSSRPRPRGQHAAGSDLDLGLAILQTLPPPPRGHFTAAEIAAVCGVSRTAIKHREEIALGKLRAAARQRGLQ